MSDNEITVSSSTDSLAEVQDAANAVPAEETKTGNSTVTDAASEKIALQEAMRERAPRWPKVESTTDSKKEIAAVQEDLNEQREARKQEYLDQPVGQSRRKLIRQVQRLNERLARYERQPIPTHPDAPAQFEQSEQAQPVEDANTQQQPPLEEQYAREMAVLEQEIERRTAAKTLPFRLKEAREQFPDYDQVCNDQVKVPTIALQFMHAQPDGHLVAYAIGKDPEVQKALLEANENNDVQAIGRILQYVSDGMKFSQKHSPQPRRQHERQDTQGPPAPIRHLGGGGGRASVPLDEADYQTFKKIRNKQEQERG